MPVYLNRIYRQAMIVLAATSQPTDGTEQPILNAASLENYQYATRLSQTSVPAFLDTPHQTESLVLKTDFSSVPIVWEQELNQRYTELGQALEEMTFLDEGDELRIDGTVYNAACYVASELLANAFPTPKVFSHGPKSVVFNWTNEADNLYLTVSTDRLSALISSPESIQCRIDLSANKLLNPSEALSAIRSAFLGEPVRRLITGTIPDPPELVS